MSWIFIGHPFVLDFESDPDAIADGAELWLNLRQAGYQRGAPIGPFTLTRVNPTLFRLSLTAEDTSGFRDGEVEGDLMLRIGEDSEPLGLRLFVPVERAI